MNIEQIRDFLLWCVAINYSLLLVWFAFFTLAHDWIQRLHGRWFRLSADHFETVHYAGMAVYKIGIILFNLVPLIALHIID